MIVGSQFSREALAKTRYGFPSALACHFERIFTIIVGRYNVNRATITATRKKKKNAKFRFQAKFPTTRVSKTVRTTDKTGKLMTRTERTEMTPAICRRTTTGTSNSIRRKFRSFLCSVRMNALFSLKIRDRPFTYNLPARAVFLRFTSENRTRTRRTEASTSRC